MKHLHLSLTLAGIALMTSSIYADTSAQKLNEKAEKETAALFEGREGTLVLVKEQQSSSPASTTTEGNKTTTSSSASSSSAFFVHNEKRANTRLSPCSTFKIPNTLIALEEGVLSSPEQIIKWEPEKHIIDTELGEEIRKNWSQDMNLLKAYKFSCVWFYKEIAEKVPSATMKKHLKEFKYGNADNSGKDIAFWLTEGPLKISANEQVTFLQNLHHRKFPLKASTYDNAEKIFMMEDTPTYTLYAKTGTGVHADKTSTGWYVGYIVRKNADPSDKTRTTYYFAFNMDDKNFQEMNKNRMRIAKALLKQHGALD